MNVTGLRDRYMQKDLVNLVNCQELLLSTVQNMHIGGVKQVTEFYDELNKVNLEAQLKVLHTLFKAQSESKIENATLSDILSYLKTIQCQTEVSSNLLREVINLAKLILLAPASNACSERSFSAMKRLKTCLRTSMSNERLTNLLLLHIHKKEVSDLNIGDVARDFINANTARQATFGFENE